MSKRNYTLKLIEATINDIDMVGGKNASLGEMMKNLTEHGICIPDGFILISAAYYEFINYNNLDEAIKGRIFETDVEDFKCLQECGLAVRTLIQNGNFPPEMHNQIRKAYQSLSSQYNELNTDVAVRSSATAEDLPDASFAGQQDTYLNICGLDSLMVAIRDCFASLFTDRAISYRKSFGYDHFQIALSVCIQKMVRSDIGVSGVAFSLDTESGFKDAVIINGSYGLGEMIVQGSVNPDEFIIFKPAFLKGFPAIIEKKLGSKETKMIYNDEGEERVRVIGTSSTEQENFCLSNEQVLKLTDWIIKIEAHYSKIKGKWCPMDIEWAVDGNSGQLFIVQARPETIHSRKRSNSVTEYEINDDTRGGKLLLSGIAVGDKIATGKVHLLKDMDKTGIQDIRFNPGDIMVTDITDPDWEPIMKIAAAIITNKGGRTCHAAIVARELGVPAIVGCGNATTVLVDGTVITASCAEGDTGLIYSGAIGFIKKEYDLNELPQTRTPVMMNVASPDMAFHYAHYPNKGVGLAREEFIINNYIKVHPLALLKHKELNDESLSEKISSMIRGYANGEDYFIEKLSYGVGKIASAFHPNKVIVRFSDFKTNEYYNLLGGKYFEPIEENPMIGWRGASRYYSSDYKNAFGMECKALKKVREKMGLENVVLMIPFCRTVDELLLVYATMKEYGLERGKNGLEVFLMAEIPSNVILADQFAKHIDGFSIGSNDLTQLILGLDRDSSLVAGLYNERDPAVKSMISSLIKTAKRHKVKVGICGQGPSDYPDFAQFLVEEGIDTISVTPDSFFKTVQAIHTIEENLKINLNESNPDDDSSEKLVA